MPVFQYVRYISRKIDIKCDDCAVTAEDFTVMVSGIPKIIKEELKDEKDKKTKKEKENEKL